MGQVIEKFKWRRVPRSWVVRFVVLIAAVWLVVQLSSGAGLRAAGEVSQNQFVKDGVLVSLEKPRLAINVDDTFTYLGRHPFTIRDVAAGERFVFVDAEGGVIRRLFMVQIESFLPGIDEIYRYDLSKSPLVAGYRFRSNGFAFDLNAARTNNPKGESAVTAAYLEARGYSVPDQWMMWRSLTVADQARKGEIILFYVEDVASAGLTLADLYHDDADTNVWVKIRGDLANRANDTFRLTGLSGDGEPLATEWTRIPD